MPSLPYRAYLISSPASPPIVRNRLDALLRQGLLDGHVAGDRFKLSRLGWTGGSPRPVITGTFRALGSGTTVEFHARMRWFDFAIALVVFGFGLSVLGLQLIAFVAGRTAPVAMASAPAIAFIVVVALVIVSLVVETGRAREILDQSLGAPLTQDELVSRARRDDSDVSHVAG